MIDNDQDFIEACANLLESAGYEVGSETREDKAVEKIREFGPGLLLLDIVMQTETGGFDIARRMLDDPVLRGIPVMFLTGFFKRASVEEQDKEILKHWPNVRDVLTKPVKPAVLLTAVRKLL